MFKNFLAHLLQAGSAVKLGSWDYADQYAFSVLEVSNLGK